MRIIVIEESTARRLTIEPLNGFEFERRRTDVLRGLAGEDNPLIRLSGTFSGLVRSDGRYRYHTIGTERDARYLLPGPRWPPG